MEMVMKAFYSALSVHKCNLMVLMRSRPIKAFIFTLEVVFRRVGRWAVSKNIKNNLANCYQTKVLFMKLKAVHFACFVLCVFKYLSYDDA